MKRVLFDENMPRKLRRDLPEFDIRTAQEQGWSAFKNGQLLKQMSDTFDVLVTIDQNIRHQQNVPKFGVSVVAIEILIRGSFSCVSSFRKFAKRLQS